MPAVKQKKLRVLPLITLIIGLAAVVAGMWFNLDLGKFRAPQLDGASLLPAPQSLADFQLIDDDNQPLTAQRLRGQWTFAFFGYTNCPDICPNTMMVLNRVAKLLAARPTGKRDPLILFISVDPERDTPEKLKSFVSYFNKSFLAATGSVEQLKNLTQQLGMSFDRAEGSGDKYAVNHSASILLISPEGDLVAKFPAWPQTPEKIVTNFQKIREYYGG